MSEIPSEEPLEIVVAAIERHRDERYHGGEVTDKNDRSLYETAIWVRSQQQEIDSEEEQDRDVMKASKEESRHAYDRDPE